MKSPRFIEGFVPGVLGTRKRSISTGKIGKVVAVIGPVFIHTSRMKLRMPDKTEQEFPIFDLARV